MLDLNRRTVVLAATYFVLFLLGGVSGAGTVFDCVEAIKDMTCSTDEFDTGGCY
jgi:hypothetical protein